MQLTVLWAVCLLPSSLALPLPQRAGGWSELQWKLAQTSTPENPEMDLGDFNYLTGPVMSEDLSYILEDTNYLKRFYPSDSKDANTLEAKLKEMQKFFHLPITGMLNSRVLEIMQKPRCGIPDVAKFSLAPGRPKWNSRIITYRLASYTADLPHATVNQLIEKAFKLWSKEVPLSFKRVKWGNADIMISFVRREHGDPYPFDGPGNMLAHAYYPGPGLGGDTHFDEDEHWTNGRDSGINLLYVATHELGHSLGLDHSSDPNAVMYPTYEYRNLEDFKLSQDDIKSIQELYGNVDSIKYE